MLKLTQTDWGQFDVAFDDPAAEDENAATATLIYAALFTDREAPASRVPERYDRRGWYADPWMGSGLWHVRRQALTDAARRETLAHVEQALARAAPALSNIAVSLDPATTAAGNVSRVSVVITGSHNGRNFTVRAPLTNA
ncbi:MAG: phage GP46 family protein [Azoarcus sp.]|jgi:phage gp46-like protein|nr:phage GP46 family protein [Azoarcus sp.]